MPTRRELLKVAGGLALVPLINMPAIAADKLPLDDPAAIALKYVEDAAAVSYTHLRAHET